MYIILREVNDQATHSHPLTTIGLMLRVLDYIKQALIAVYRHVPSFKLDSMTRKAWLFAFNLPDPGSWHWEAWGGADLK